MNDRPRLIDKGFAEFMTKIGLAYASRSQYREMRRAFFAGARFYMKLVMEQADGGDEPTDRDMALMDAFEAEIAEFIEDLKAGLA